MKRLFRTFWNVIYFCRVFWRTLMQKMGRQQKKEVVRWNVGKIPFWMDGGWLWKFRGILHIWGSYGNCWIHLGEYWCMLDWILSQNCRNAPTLHIVDQLVRSEKTYETLFYLFELGIRNRELDTDWMEWYHTVKACMRFEGYCLKFWEVWTNSMKFKLQVGREKYCMWLREEPLKNGN